MKREIEVSLNDWKQKQSHKPLILIGARQVGKSYLIRNALARSFASYLEVNFEERPDYKDCFQPDLSAANVIRRLELRSNQRIIPGETLVFFDEAQLCPESLIALRYLYEQIPDLHVVAAGSLINFALENISIPVGRVTFRHLGPLSFEEYLFNSDHTLLLSTILEHDFSRPFDEMVHKQALNLLKEYMAIGGMPEVVANFIKNRDYLAVQEIQNDLISTYQHDFPKYTKKNAEYRYVETTFAKIPQLVGQQFKYVQIAKYIKSNYIRQAIDLLSKAGVLSRIYCTTGLPLKGKANLERYKLLYLDVGLMQRACALPIDRWLGDSSNLMNTGAVAEQFVGQQIKAHSHFNEQDLFYWERNKRGSSAEIDYLLEKNGHTFPIEVKAGAIGSLKSMKLYLNRFADTPFGIRLSTGNICCHEKLISIPSYALGAWMRQL